MKAILAILLTGLLTYSVCAQTNNPTAKHHHKKGDTNAPAGAAPDAPPPDPAADQAKMIQAYQKAFVPTDPWRVMDGKTNFAKGGDWVQFEGRVTRSSADGLLLQGWYGPPLCYMMPGGGGSNGMTSGIYNLSGYPRGAAIGQLFSRNDKLVALKSGTKGDLVNLEYGTVWVQELTEEQKAQAAEAKSKTAAKVLAWQKEQADKGDAYGEYKMGVRYLNGDGVDKSVDKARELLTKSAAQGNQEAATELAKIPSN